jgi:UDP-glucose 4-epimerase
MGSVLVTGGAGFIGSHLVEKLVEKSYNVIVVDNLLKGKLNNLSNVLDEIKFIKGDIRNYKLMEELIKNSEVIFHLASLSRVIPSIENPKLCFKINVEGTEIIARLCSKHHKKLIFSSSREVYGTSKYLPVDEDHPLNPENPYGASKVSGEKIIEVYTKNYGLSYVTLRLTNVYGSRDFDRVIPIFIKNALEEKNLVVYGVNKILDFVHIDDVINAFISAMNSNGNQTLNIGSGVGISIIELANLVKKITGKKVKIIIEKGRKGEVDKFIANIKRAKEVLNWEPKIDLEKGLRLTVKEYRLRCSKRE